MNILFVCTGNINRSPASEIIYKTLSPSDNVTSAALTNKNRNITSKAMRDALKKSGYKYVEIYSKPVTQALINWADIIFYMQKSHLRDLQKFGVSKKYVNLAKYIHKERIHDPHFDKSHDMVVRDIEKAIKNYLFNKNVINNRSLFL